MARGPGRPVHVPTAERRLNVEAMVGCGIPQADIAIVFDLDEKTLRKHYRNELDKGSIKANAHVASSLYKKALGPGKEGVTAAIFWLKTRAGWKDTSKLELSGPQGGPIQTETTKADLSGLTQDDRDSLREILERAAGGSQGDAEGD
jgi:hypothetical protein